MPTFHINRHHDQDESSNNYKQQKAAHAQSEMTRQKTAEWCRNNASCVANREPSGTRTLVSDGHSLPRENARNSGPNVTQSTAPAGHKVKRLRTAPDQQGARDAKIIAEQDQRREIRETLEAQKPKTARKSKPKTKARRHDSEAWSYVDDPNYIPASNPAMSAYSHMPSYGMGHSPYYPPSQMQPPQNYFVPEALQLQDPRNSDSDYRHGSREGSSSSGTWDDVTPDIRRKTRKTRTVRSQYDQPPEAPTAARKPKRARKPSGSAELNLSRIRNPSASRDDPPEASFAPRQRSPPTAGKTRFAESQALAISEVEEPQVSVGRPRRASDAPKKTHGTRFLESSGEHKPRRASEPTGNNHPSLQPAHHTPNALSSAAAGPSRATNPTDPLGRMPALKSALKELADWDEPNYSETAVSAPAPEASTLTAHQNEPSDLVVRYQDAEDINNALFSELEDMMADLDASDSGTLPRDRHIEMDIDIGSKDTVLHFDMRMAFQAMRDSGQKNVGSREDFDFSKDDEFARIQMPSHRQREKSSGSAFQWY